MSTQQILLIFKKWNSPTIDRNFNIQNFNIKYYSFTLVPQIQITDFLCSSWMILICIQKLKCTFHHNVQVWEYSIIENNKMNIQVCISRPCSNRYKLNTLNSKSSFYVKKDTKLTKKSSFICLTSIITD